MPHPSHLLGIWLPATAPSLEGGADEPACLGITASSTDGGYPRFIDVQALKFEAEPLKPLPNLIRSVPVGELRVVPVEIHENVEVVVVVRIPEALHDVPVEEALDVLSSRPDAQKRNRLRQVHFRIHLCEGAAELRYRT